MTTGSQSKKLTEPLESVTAFFGMLMVIGVAAGAGLLAFGSGGIVRVVCVTQPYATYGSSGWNTPFVSARPGGDVSIVGSLQACAAHPSLAQRVLDSLTVLPAVVFWCGVLLLLWRIVVAARRTGPFTPRIAAAMRVLGWFVIIGSTTSAVVHLLALDQLLVMMAKVPNSFTDLLTVPLHMPVPVLAGAALLTFARIISAGSVMDDEIKATI